MFPPQGDVFVTIDKLTSTGIKVVSETLKKPGHGNKAVHYFVLSSLFGRKDSFTVCNWALCEGTVWDVLSWPDGSAYKERGWEEGSHALFTLVCLKSLSCPRWGRESHLMAGTGWGPRWYPHRPFPISQCLWGAGAQEGLGWADITACMWVDTHWD